MHNVILTAIEIYCWLWLLILVHEVGHLLVAYWLDRPVLAMRVGNGPVLGLMYWNGISCQFRLLPFTGVVYLAFRSRCKVKNQSITVAGPIVNLILIGPLTWIGADGAAAMSFGLAVMNLLPFRGTDGYELWAEWRRVRPPLEVL